MAKDITKNKTVRSNLEAKQVGNNKMLLTADVDGMIVYHRQNIADVETDKLERKIKILSANIDLQRPVINASKIKKDKTLEIATKLNEYKGGNR